MDARVLALEEELGRMRKIQEEQGEANKAAAQKSEEQFAQLLAFMEKEAAKSIAPPSSSHSQQRIIPPDPPPGFTRSNQSQGQNQNQTFNEGAPLMIKKVEFPEFDGEDVLTWVSKAEQYFSIQATRPVDRVTTAMVSLNGSALNWIRWLSQQRPYFAWEDLKMELVKRYMGIDASNRFEHLSSIKQTGSVDEFVNELIACASHTHGLGNDQLLGYFLAGMKPEIRVDLQSFEAHEFMAAMDGARRVERKLNFEKGFGRGSWKRPSNHNIEGKDWAQKSWASPHSPNQGGVTRSQKEREPYKPSWSPNPTGSGNSGSNPRNRFTRTLSPTEYNDCKAKGLCFKCKQPFSPMHKCSERVFKLVELSEDEIAAAEGELELIQIGEGIEPGLEHKSESDLQWLELPLHSMNNGIAKRSLKIRVKLGERKVIALVDSGASHCFVNAKIVEVEELEVETTSRFGVRLGNGSRVETSGICRALPLHFGSCDMAIDCYPFDLGNIDIILGFSCYKAMKKTLVDWEEMTIQFDGKDGKKVTIQGDPTLAISEVSMNSLHKITEIEYEALIWAVQKSEAELSIAETDDRQLREFLVAAVAEEFWNRDEILRQLKWNLDRAQKRMVAYANKKRRDLEFKEGELVFLKLRPHRQKTLLHRLNQKLAPRYFGPFLILKKIGAVAYELQLPASSKLHPVFHVSLLKRVIGTHQAVTDLPADLTLEEEEFSPEAILEVQKQSKGPACHKVLVQWEGKSTDEASWMTCEDFKKQFPGSNLVDKVCSDGRGIVRVDGYIVYGRRKMASQPNNA
ncbi:hypothetical protein V2J09_011098 [Rumex salicifolius]